MIAIYLISLFIILVGFVVLTLKHGELKLNELLIVLFIAPFPVLNTAIILVSIFREDYTIWKRSTKRFHQ